MPNAATSRVLCVLALVVAPGIAVAAQTTETPERPLEMDLEEHVETQLVLVDVVVLDRRDRPVPGLVTDDFELRVAGKPVEIVSLDTFCPEDGLDDPVARGATAFPPLPVPAAAQQARRIVLAVDYYHLGLTVRTLEQLRDTMRNRYGGEEIMLVSIGNIVRIETPFTTDPDEIIRALQRMQADVDLYAGFYGRLTERRFFDRMQVLFDALERMPGKKMIVLLSGPFQPDGFTYDDTIKRVASRAARARASIYTVDTGGLRSDPGLHMGGPEMLRRLSLETGGRPTADTNDLGLAYVKARGDLACGYTLGFYDRSPRLDRDRRINVWAGGRRVMYPTSYVIRSMEKRRRSLGASAAMMPQMFDADGLEAQAFLVRPRSGHRWQTVLAARIEGARGPAGRQVGLEGFLRRPNGTIVHRFERRVDAGDLRDGLGTLFDTARVRPGRYTLSLVLSREGADTPSATLARVQFPEIPEGDLFFVGPTLTRESASSLKPEKTDGGLLDTGRFLEPLIAPEATRGELLVAVTRVCLVGSEANVHRTVSRVVLSTDDEPVLEFDPADVDLAGDGAAECVSLVDDMPTARLEPGEYRMVAYTEWWETGLQGGRQTFTIRERTAQPVH